MRSDNATIVACIRHREGIRSLAALKEANHIIPWTETRSIDLCSPYPSSGQLEGRLSQPPLPGSRDMKVAFRCLQANMTKKGDYRCGHANLQIQQQTISIFIRDLLALSSYSMP